MTRAFRVMLFATALAALAGGGHADMRWALVVGVSRYDMLPALRNPVNDARAIASVLRSAGFEVTTLYDPTSKQLRAAIWGSSAKAAGSVALLYYAGHAVNFHNQNLLLGADADPRNESSLKAGGVPLTDFTQFNPDAARHLIFLDACRTPLSFALPHMAPGHAPEWPGAQTLFEFSAGPEQTASDGKEDERNSPFARSMLHAMATPGVELGELLLQVRRDVEKITDDQNPQTVSHLKGDFFLIPTPEQQAREAAIHSPAPGEGIGVNVLLARLGSATGVKRLYGLEDTLGTGLVQRGLDASQALAAMGDIPAPALRRHALSLLLPSLLAPVSEPETVRLLAAFDGSARAAAIKVLMPCLDRPLAEQDLDEVLGDVRLPERRALAQALVQPNKANACPALRS